MPKKIKWTGSLSHEVRGVVKLKYGEVVTLDDDVVRQLPRTGYELLKNIKATEGNKEGDEGRIKEPETLNEEDDNSEVEFTEEQDKFYKEHTLQQMMKMSGESGIEVPSFLKKKSEVFQFLLDNGFQVGE